VRFDLLVDQPAEELAGPIGASDHCQQLRPMFFTRFIARQQIDPQQETGCRDTEKCNAS
jgi:hypothetical protein